MAFLPHKTLLEVLREDMGLTGTKHGCGIGACGTCTVIVDGLPVASCLQLAALIDGAAVRTVEGLAGTSALHVVQQAFINKAALQCGICTPGFLIAARALLEVNPDPTEAEARYWLAGNLCRCTGYVKSVEAVQAAAGER